MIFTNDLNFLSVLPTANADSDSKDSRTDETLIGHKLKLLRNKSRKKRFN